MLKEKGDANGMDLFPLTFRLGMMATPVKKFPDNPYYQRNVHIDCFKKIPMDYEDYLFGEYEGKGEIVLDKIQRQGADTLYLHEKWNDLQNSPELTASTAERLKLIVKEAHKRNIKVVPYFGYEISTLSPEFGKHYDEYVSKDGFRGNWYRKPWQRDIVVCYNSGWQDYFVENIKKLFENYNIDGIYLDSIMPAHSCKNEKHGCGYRDYDGNLKATYPVWAVRNLMRRLYKMVKEYGGFIASHSYGCFSLGSIAYSDMLWEGESVQSPKPNDAGKFLDEMSGVWKALSSFDFNGAEWKPYYDNDVRTDNKNVAVSYYDNEKQALLFVSNMKNSPTDKVKITLPQKFRSVVNAVSGMKYDAEKIIVEFEKFDYVILSAEK